MRRNFTLSILILLVISISQVAGQILLEENFDYPAGDTLSNLGWTQIRNGNPITISQSGLEFTGYALSGIGNAAVIKSDGGQEVRKSFNSQNSDSIYVSYLINVTEASVNTSGGIYLYLVPESGNIFSRRCTAYLKKNESNQLNFGIAKNGGIGYTGYDYELNATYLVVLKYKFNTDTTDLVSLWVNPDLSAPETVPDAFTDDGSDAEALSGIALSQLTASNEPPDAIIDGIRVTTTWQDLAVDITEEDKKTPATFRLEQNYPNPFNPRTMIRYTINKKSNVRLTVYNVLGQQVAVLIDEIQPAGTHRISWNAGTTAAGIYFYRIQAGQYSQTRRMIYIK